MVAVCRRADRSVRRYRTTDVSAQLATLGQLCHFDALELLDADDQCVHARAFAEGWVVELVRSERDDVIDLVVNTSAVSAYVAYLESLGATRQDRGWRRRLLGDERLHFNGIDVLVLSSKRC